MPNLSRRKILLSAISIGAVATATSILGACKKIAKTNPAAFVKRDGLRFTINDKPYRFVGANLWYGAYLGADAAYGDRARLGRELDRMKAIGITNLRVMASAEEGPLKAGIKPGFRTKDGWNETLFDGLDYLMVEIAKRDMKAVLCLTNFWEWSGGVMTYLYYQTGKFTDMNDPEHPWPAFPDHASDFYKNEAAVGMYHDHVRRTVGRKNKITGVDYRDDPAIMAWQLCNEPRPGNSQPVMDKILPDYYAWINSTAKIIREIDGNHLVSLGQEGTKASNGSEQIFIEAHQQIDYLTAHIWPLNWSWVDGKNLGGTWDDGAAKVNDYINTHVRLANQIGKALVFEEFGFPRDGELYDPEIPATFKERFYKMIYAAVEQSMANNGPVVGSNFWAWNGEARTPHADHRFKPGDTQYMGDPPHEPQGWYGVFDSDASMHKIIMQHAKNISAS
ncbi:mannanase [Sphingorhabdus lutea]|uniref:mannan endo-1,4-beta-mannosidase n=1 Tax=Sphingorhabdus lutea TaxID=1913578 RepID=A0A1L3JAA3_9SPHN|nr:cellulase family glycosylhydrolase [Sphingorhabdus lutea]APG62054.1 mannanase [Sphingorhabdus lutea]